MRLCTLGDLLLDVVARLEQPLASGSDTRAVTRVGAGGQAANVAAWAVELGAAARLIGARATDVAAELVARELADRGVELAGPAVDGRNGVVVSLAEPGGERTMASDRGVAPELRAEDLDPAWFDGCEWLHVAGYSLVLPPIDGAAARAASLARDNGAGVSVDVSAWTVVRELGAERFRERLAALAPDVVFANEREREELGAFAAPTWVVKRGARGCRVEVDGEAAEFAAVDADVADTTGAGDAFAAGFIVGGPELGLETAARCVAQLGAMP